MTWTCKLCDKKEYVHEVTDGTFFVLHHCRCFGGANISGQIKNMHRYVSNMMQFFHKPAVNITVFPLREVV